ncbi:hypothetical protein CAOG_01567 [Capsaspora owczarzaki ATCC 30864]|uniref:NADH dehydrogenase [ubiquinone] 1 beta subcomplex subunit 2 n=1 Tax=Capsaspora owczarzaki (strain ATCC 30864) TaxID=595528 RepID=A0A0D2U4Z1_CAPO3|nr:hypothetical protein CAOG_01567 [Capsaspora owczarzaki ATCC 30864]KJE90226.1 hypothetical protein CAOG_001567 [Capsaspora owczarzaki ATCC 30864]|eukprot:XP_004364435.1 hypothetical protein CAOG_01567 [Capsaspora owczarzaki ATCC 30864]
MGGAAVAAHGKTWHHYAGKLMGATMWFWVFHRLREDGDVLLGYRKAWEHKGHHGSHHTQGDPSHH